MKKIKKSIALILTIIMTVVGCGILNASADRQSDLQNEISALEKKSKELEAQIRNLKSENADKQKLVNALQAKINNTEQQIIACNNEISKINSTIAKNKAEINRQNKEIEDTKLAFKKRLRAIYMNNTDNSAQILLGADNFANFLQLEQLTSAISAHDKAIIDDIVEVIKDLEEKQKQNETLLKNQLSIKETVLAKQKSLESEQAEIRTVMNSINSQTNDLAAQNKNVEAEIKKAQKALDDLFDSLNPPSFDQEFNGKFYWPVPGYYYISQRWGVGGHTGMDIAGGGISGKPIVAVADGRVSRMQSGWNSGMGTSGMASYGNYVILEHGKMDGKNFHTYYAHMSRTAVSPGQTVKAGQVIGYVGNTGRVFGANGGYHLHIEFRLNGRSVNPYPYLRK